MRPPLLNGMFSFIHALLSSGGRLYLCAVFGHPRPNKVLRVLFGYNGPRSNKCRCRSVTRPQPEYKREVTQMVWSQIYDPMNNAVLSTARAAVPVVVLLGGLALLRLSQHVADGRGLDTAHINDSLVS